MTLNNTIQTYLSKDSVVDILTRYELYYHISLGNFVLETLQDFDETMAKLAELNLQIEVNIALSNILEIILSLGNKDDFQERYEYHVRSRAITHALKDFVNHDEELINADDYIAQKTKAILDDTYFTETMKLQLESDYSLIYEHYEMMITDEIIKKIHGNLQEKK
jgi:hypothetical protein